MQDQHPDSLVHYVQYYNELPLSAKVTNPILKEFTSERMVINYTVGAKSATLVHLFDPPMRPGQARTRLEEMHKQAKKAIGIVRSSPGLPFRALAS